MMGAGLGLKTRLRRLFPATRAPRRAPLVLVPEARPAPSAPPPGGPFQGYVDAASDRHVAGWLRDLGQPGARVEYEVVAHVGGQPRILHVGCADEADSRLVALGIGDGRHAFYARLPPLSAADRATLKVQVLATGEALPSAPAIQREWQPIRYVALDVVDNCNLRCPFCLFDYTGVNKTNVMDPAHFQSALRLLPYTTLGNFWLSCLHEPTLHPQFEALLAMIPAGRRDKVFYTTNLAKRMPPSYYESLASSGLHNLNISVESFDPAIYERLRKGAKHRIFSANWDLLLQAFARGSAPPKLRYIIMGYKSNLAELPSLVRRLRAEKQAWQVEIRYTYPEPHIPAAFATAEFLDAADWAWLRGELAGYDPSEVILITPPAGAAPAALATAPDPGEAVPVDGPVPPTGKPRAVSLRITYDGHVEVNDATDPANDHDAGFRASRIAARHITEIDDPEAFLAGLVD